MFIKQIDVTYDLFSDFYFSVFLQQLMRERQQLANRPFASVTVALEAPEEEEELLQGQVEVGTFNHRLAHIR